MKKRILSALLVFVLIAALPLSASAAISKSQAKNIALRHAGYQSSRVRFQKVHKERDDGRWVFDVEFRVRGTRIEYSYEIAVRNGRIVDWDRDIDD